MSISAWRRADGRSSGRRPAAGFSLALLCCAAWIVPGYGQTPNPAAQRATAQKPLPDINGVWGHNGFGFRVPYISPKGEVIDGLNNAYLKPWTAESVMRDYFAERSGRLIPTTHTTCYPDGTPDVFALREMQVVQTPTEVVLLFQDDMQARHIYLDKPHSAHVTPSFYGESVGHWQGNTLVVDTIGISVNPQAKIDRYGTPHSDALHIVERFELLEDEGNDNTIFGRPGQQNNRLDTIIPGAKKSLRLVFTVEDPGAFKKPWSVTLDYKPLRVGLEEEVCAENNRDWRVLVPTADTPDF